MGMDMEGSRLGLIGVLSNLRGVTEEDYEDPLSKYLV
jgi:hypothetical protein